MNQHLWCMDIFQKSRIVLHKICVHSDPPCTADNISIHQCCDQLSVVAVCVTPALSSAQLINSVKLPAMVDLLLQGPQMV